jgi:hypothetical protein
VKPRTTARWKGLGGGQWAVDSRRHTAYGRQGGEIDAPILYPVYRLLHSDSRLLFHAPEKRAANEGEETGRE